MGRKIADQSALPMLRRAACQSVAGLQPCGTTLCEAMAQFGTADSACP